MNTNLSLNRALSRGRSATLIVAASNASARSKRGADYVCDGTADEVEINAALTTIGTGSVYLTEGIYTVSATINVPSYCHLKGTGNATKIQPQTSTNVNPLIHLNNVSYARVSDLYLFGDKTHQTYDAVNIQSLLTIYQCAGIMIRNIWGFYGVNAGLYYYGNASNIPGHIISQCFFNNNRNGIILGDEGEYLKINNCQINSNSDKGIWVNGAGNIAINNTSINSNVIGVYADGSVGSNPTKITIGNSHINHNTTHGVHIYKNSKVSIMNSNIIANTQHGLFLDGASYCTIMGNTISANDNNTDHAYDEICLASESGTPSVYNTIIGNIVSSYALTKKARYNINESDANCDLNVIEGNMGIIATTGAVRTQGGGSKSYDRHQDMFMDCQVTDVDGVHTAIQDLSGTHTDVTSPDVPRCLTVTQAGTGTPKSGNVVVTGVDARGISRTETIAMTANNTTIAGIIPFATVTNVVGFAANTDETLSVGWNDVVGLSNRITATTDVYKVKKANANLTIPTVSATNGTVDLSTISDGDDFTIFYKSDLNKIA